MKKWLSKHITSVIAPLLLLFQSIPVLGFFGLMVFPIAIYLFSIIWILPGKYDEIYTLQREWLPIGILKDKSMDTLFLSRDLLLGRVVALGGLIIFLAGLISLLKKRRGVVKSKLYSLVRHPQYLGFIIMTWGISIMSIQYTGRIDYILHSWFLMAIAYILLACYEEWYLLKKHKKEYQEYKLKVPFIFPIPCPHKIPQTLFTIVILLVFAFLITIF